MKRIILLINFLASAFFMQAQEKMSFQLNGKTIEFNISQEEMYVEFIENQKSAIQRISKDGFEELSNNSAILKMSELKGSFNKRKLSLRGKTSQNFQRIEPVLIYKDRFSIEHRGSDTSCRACTCTISKKQAIGRVIYSFFC